MDNEDARRHERDHESSPVTNAEYSAVPGHNGFLIRKLSDGHSQPYTINFGVLSSRHDPILSFHPSRPNLLATSSGSQLAIFDVESCAAKHVFKGTGRIVTSTAFAHNHAGTLAIGTADGTITLWSVKEPSRPLHLLRGLGKACSNIAFHPRNSDVVAALHGYRISVWKLPTTKPITTIGTKPGTLRLFSWCSEGEDQIITVSHGGIVSIYDLKDALRGSAVHLSATAAQESDEEDGLNARLEGIQKVTPSTAFNLATSIYQARVLGQNGLVILPASQKDLYFYNFSLGDRNMTELWRLHKETAIDAFAFRRNGNSVEVMVVTEGATEVYKVPAPVLDSMGCTTELQSSLIEFVGDTTVNSRTALPQSGSMRPRKMIRPRTVEPKIQKSRERPRAKRTKKEKDTPVKSKSRKLKHDLHSRPGTPTTHSMTSSLELPKGRPDADEHDSPMPFLSPNIPARKASPGLITPLDENMQLPPLAYFDSATPADDHLHESDSDDETFAGDMKSSGTFLPGGVNVPLPKTCGALFSPNGQLITFFPYRVRRTANESHLESKSPTTANKHGEEVNKLFPGFGNLGNGSFLLSSPSDSDNSGSEEEQTSGPPRFAIHASSFDGKPSWVVKASPIKTNMGSLPGEQRVTVSVRSLESLTPTRQSLADTYELFASEGLSNGDLCLENAMLATKEGLDMSARAWRLLAMVLEPRIANTLGVNVFGDLSQIFLGRRPAMSRNTSMASSRNGYSAGRVAETFPLLDLPFGRSWATEQLFAWAEARADIQLLACMSTLLERACATLRDTAKKLRQRQSSSVHPRLNSDVSALDPSMFPPGVPALHTEGMGPATTDNSPNKAYRSRLSSGNPSQPTTPYLDSSNSTPPFAFSNIVRQSSKLTMSGSASPEHQRSSFGAAAKNYAASIAEKFGSYGSSPPLKKLGTSPGNELSSSLPTAPGSWSKSVSFASNMEQSKNSRRSLSLAQEDDNYDSDRTIEDNSVVVTPKKPNTGVSVTNKRGNFFDEKAARSSMQTPVEIMSEQLAVKSSFWRHHYADQLLSWGMLIEAGEMGDAPTSSPTQPFQSDYEHDAVAPKAATGRKFNDCSICFCIVQTAEQICPACLHVTHPACLDDFLSALGDSTFTCPTGCGCDCTSATAVSFATDDEAAIHEEAVESAHSFKKKPSLTDPLRLRQRLQGESW